LDYLLRGGLMIGCWQPYQHLAAVILLPL